MVKMRMIWMMVMKKPRAKTPTRAIYIFHVPLLVDDEGGG